GAYALLEVDAAIANKRARARDGRDLKAWDIWPLCARIRGRLRNAMAMIQAIAAFSGGLWVQNRLSDLQLPHLSGSIPGLSDNGLLTRERPRVAAVLGNVRKETEFGDVADDDEDFGVDDDIPSCDWKFNETLTFAASVNDIMAGQTVQLWLHTKSDVYLGPFQMNLARNRDVGVCSVEIRKQILPECVPVDERAGDSARHGESPPGGAKRGPHLVWETKVLPFALTHVDSNSGTGNFVLGQAALLSSGPLEQSKKGEEQCFDLRGYFAKLPRAGIRPSFAASEHEDVNDD
ncbi:unnamed protein product, partial [Symbiodinium sp. KB8]